VVKELALGNPEVSFFLHHNGRLIHSYVAQGRANRVQEALRPSWKPFIIQENHDFFAFEAFLSPPENIQDRGDLLLYINGRSVKHKGIFAAVRNAYASTLGPHHEPVGVIYLSIRKDWLDVNVHPQKWEVRILKQENLYPWVIQVIRKAIGSHRSAKEIILPSEENKRESPSLLKDWTPPAQMNFRPIQEPIIFYDSISPSQDSPPLLHYLGQIKATYLLCEDKEGMILMDQHALHEKLTFESLISQLKTQPIAIQPMLVPKVFSLPSEYLPLWENHKDDFAKLGFEMDAFGEKECVLKTHPAQLTDTQSTIALFDLLKMVAKETSLEGITLDNLIRPWAATVACHASVRAGQALTAIEAKELISRLDHLEMGWTCPHGRPVLLRLSYGQIEKHFKRT
jgi:DNA mismatch repair protein MutL